MNSSRAVIFDTNFLDRLHQIDATCSILDLLIEVFGTIGVADHRQLNLMDYCTHLASLLNDHGITDEDTGLFLMTYSGKQPLGAVKKDPADVKIFVFATRNAGATVLTCDKALLILCASHSVPHFCFKAAVHRVDSNVGGLFNQTEFRTEQMFEVPGSHPFFHYSAPKHCPACDPNRSCETQVSPPRLVRS